MGLQRPVGAQVMLLQLEMPRDKEQQVCWVSSMVLLLLCMIFLCHALVPPVWSGHIHHCIVEACNLFLIL